ncbi:MAG: sulfatase-like hydrolase/transferase [Pirellulales bacterium]
MRTAFVLVMTVWLGNACLAADLVPKVEPLNVVLIVADDQHWRDYGFMGHPHVKTPHLDRFAAQSLVFPRGYVPSSLCRPSLATILTGKYPHQHGITSNDPPLPAGKTNAQANRDPEFLKQREATIAKMDRAATLPRWLAPAGYRSFQTGKWWEGDFRRGGFTHGMSEGGRHGDKGLEIGRKTMAPLFDFIAHNAKRTCRSSRGTRRSCRIIPMMPPSVW